MTTEQPQIPPDEAETAIEVHRAPERPHMGFLAVDTPEDMMTVAARMATLLSDMIRKRGLISKISGREYVQCEGWTCLAAMMGVTPHEITNLENDDGSYTATIELRSTDGRTISRASAECGRDEQRWMEMPPYARRSMAQTRATGKACRLAFSWIMVMAGYAPTPAEEMSHDSEPFRPDRAAGGENPKCPECQFELKRGKKRNEDAFEWYCWRAKGGCGKRYDEDEQTGVPIFSAATVPSDVPDDQIPFDSSPVMRRG
jgi:hypothetical protein